MAFRVLDLFCGAGGAARGYADAGFEVVGVDIKPQPRYPHTFYQHDALSFLSHLLGYCCWGDDHEGWSLQDFDLIHASPPCQGYSQLRHANPGRVYPMLIEPTRELLKATGLPYVIENVPGAPLTDPVVLCGSHFGLTVDWPEGKRTGLRRHRLFEANFPIPDPGSHDHSLRSLPVYGNSAPGNRPEYRGRGFAGAARKVMGIDWTNRDELVEAIPPAYTRYIGEAAMAHLARGRYDLAA